MVISHRREWIRWGDENLGALEPLGNPAMAAIVQGRRAQILNMAKQFEIMYSRRLLELQQFPLTSPTEHSYRSVYVP